MTYGRISGSRHSVAVVTPLYHPTPCRLFLIVTHGD